MKLSRWIHGAELLALACIVALIGYFAIGAWLPARFEVVNLSDRDVEIEARWRDRVHPVGMLAPDARVTLSIDGPEGTAHVLARDAGGRQLQSDPIYFDHGIGVEVRIMPHGIVVQYDRF